MISIEFDADGDGHTLYTDDIDLRLIGKLTDIHRASHIEFDQDRQEWCVIHGDTKQIIYRHSSRERCIAWEQQNLGPEGEYYETN
jgi:hypothetical protein